MSETFSDDAYKDTPPAENHSLSSATLTLLTKALFYIYFGLFISLILIFAMSFTSITSFIQFPSYVIGSAIMLYGALLLHTNKTLKNNIGFKSNILVFCSAMYIYFAPFVSWWIESPMQLIFFINVIFFIILNIITLFTLNLMVARIYFLINMPQRISEAYFAAASVVFLMLVPFAAWLGSAIFRIIRYQSDFVYEATYGAITLFEMFPSFTSLFTFKKTALAMFILFILPLPHTLAVLWRAARFCRKHLFKER